MDAPKQYGLNVRMPAKVTKAMDAVFDPAKLHGWRKLVMQLALLAVTGKWEKTVRVNP